MARQKSKHLGQMAKVLVATHLEIMGVAYIAVNGLIVAEGIELNCSDADGICNDDFAVARAALEKALAPLGRAIPMPPRTPVPLSRRESGDQDGNVWRENQIRRLPNPPNWVFEKYLPICQAAAQKFLAHNLVACRRIGMDRSDLQQYTGMWLILFWGKYRLLEDKLGGDNARLLRTFLAQRFAQLYAQITPRPHLARSCPTCKVETDEDRCCSTPTATNRLAGRPPRDGLRMRRQLGAPDDVHYDDIGREDHGVGMPGWFGNQETTRGFLRIQQPPQEVRLGTLKWSAILDQLNRKEEKHRIELLQDLAAQDYSKEISVAAKGEIDRLSRIHGASLTDGDAAAA